MPDVSSSSELHIDSVDKGKADLYGCFSPRGGLNTSSLSVASRSEAADVVAPVLQFMSELQELCGVSSVIHPMELVSLEALEVATMPSPSPPPSEPCQPNVIVGSGGLDASVSTMHVVSLSDGIDKAGVLAPNSEALFGKEICDLLISLEAASPGYGKEIACVLAGDTSEDLIKKVEKSLSIIKIKKIRKRRVTMKASAAA
jgi:hypothetical protein